MVTRLMEVNVVKIVTVQQMGKEDRHTDTDGTVTLP
jgi:hypothetical protein